MAKTKKSQIDQKTCVHAWDVCTDIEYSYSLNDDGSDTTAYATAYAECRNCKLKMSSYEIENILNLKQHRV